MIPSRTRTPVEELRSEFEISERTACAVLDQPYSSQPYQAKARSDERFLVNRMLELGRERPRFGYRRIGALVRRESWSASDTLEYRLWRQESLKTPEKRRNQRRVRDNEIACHRRHAKRPGDVWAWSFAFDRTLNGGLLKWLSIVDEYTRESLALKVDRSITSEDLINPLAELFARRSVPSHLRSDNGPQFIAAAIQNCLQQRKVRTLHIEPGIPWENGYAESFVSKLRDDFLSMEHFMNLSEARKRTKA